MPRRREHSAQSAQGNGEKEKLGARYAALQQDRELFSLKQEVRDVLSAEASMLAIARFFARREEKQVLRCPRSKVGRESFVSSRHSVVDLVIPREAQRSEAPSRRGLGKSGLVAALPRCVFVPLGWVLSVV